MKMLFIGLMVLGSISSFASERIEIKKDSVEKVDLTSECKHDFSNYYFGIVDLNLVISGVSYKKKFQVTSVPGCEGAKERVEKLEELNNFLRDLDDIDKGHIQVLSKGDKLLCYKDTMTLLTDTVDDQNIVKSIISSHTVVACP